MNGKEVYRFAINRVPDAIDKVIHQANLTSENIDWLILHQANQRIMDAVAERLHIPAAKVISNVAKYGNTSAASIPIAMSALLEEHPELHGGLALLIGYGAGLVYAGQVVELP